MFDALPEAFGSYRVLEAIGDGRFGPVYRAREETTGLFVAVKVFDQGLTVDQARLLAAALDRLREAPLNHPAIVPVLAAGTVEKRVWSAEPWFDAGPLDTLMRRNGAQPFGEVLLRVAQIAGALDFAAAVDLHHGALHPRDILVSGDQTVVVGIGVLQALNDAGLVVPMEGAYVSPQRAQGVQVRGSDDVFSLAAITYELVYGAPVPPRSRLRTASLPPAGIDHKKLVDVLERALSPEAEARPSTALSFAEAIQAGRLPVSDAELAAPIPESEPPIARDVAPPAPRAVEPPIAVRVADATPPPEPLVVDLPVADLPLRAASAPPPPIVDPPRYTVAPPSDITARTADREPRIADRGARTTETAPRIAANDVRIADSGSRTAADPPSPGYWFPISATLAIGLLLGFASGYIVGQREALPTPRAPERAVARSDQQQAPPESPPVSTSGRDYTESVVPPQGTADRPAASPNQGAEPVTGTDQPVRRDATDRGVLQIDSRPRGARVFVDGRLVGTTPVIVPEVVPGAHAVRIDLRGHRRWVTSVEVAPGERQRVAASLER